MKIRHSLVPVIAACGLLVASAHATVIHDPLIGPGDDLAVRFVTADFTYDAGTGVFSGVLDGATRVGTSTAVSGPLTVILILTPEGLLGGGGAVSWIGGSADLGIAAGSVLLSGTVTQFATVADPLFGPGSGIWQMAVDVDESAAALGLTDRVLLDLFGVISPASMGLDTREELEAFRLSGDSIYTRNFTASNPTFNDIFNTVTVPEPGALALMGAGLGLLAGWRRRRLA